MKQFKVGDWVYDRLEESYTKQEKLFRVTDLLYKKHYMKYRIDRFQLWQPKEGELIINKDINGIITIEKYYKQLDIYPFIGEITWLHKTD